MVVPPTKEALRSFERAVRFAPLATASGNLHGACFGYLPLRLSSDCEYCDLIINISKHQPTPRHLIDDSTCMTNIPNLLASVAYLVLVLVRLILVR